MLQDGTNKKIDNAVANIVWKGELVVAFGHSFVEVIGESSYVSAQ
jgi:hypothetical protein